jgi:hypothetical protein
VDKGLFEFPLPFHFLNVLQVWGEAYQATSGPTLLHLMLSQSAQGAKIQHVLSSISRAPPFGFPAAQDQPMFYVVIYVLIGVAANLVNVSLVALHFYGGLRSVLPLTPIFSLKLILVQSVPPLVSQPAEEINVLHLQMV